MAKKKAKKKFCKKKVGLSSRLKRGFSSDAAGLEAAVYDQARVPPKPKRR